MTMIAPWRPAPRGKARNLVTFSVARRIATFRAFDRLDGGAAVDDALWAVTHCFESAPRNTGAGASSGCALSGHCISRQLFLPQYGQGSFAYVPGGEPVFTHDDV